jgi:hypothetical protein
MRNIHRYPHSLRSDFQIDCPLMNSFLCEQKRSLKVTRECTKVAYQAVAASIFLYYPKVIVKALNKYLCLSLGIHVRFKLVILISFLFRFNVYQININCF